MGIDRRKLSKLTQKIYKMLQDPHHYRSLSAIWDYTELTYQPPGRDIFSALTPYVHNCSTQRSTEQF